MSTVFVHKYAGILSAYGMALADVVEEAQEPSVEMYFKGIYHYLFLSNKMFLANVVIKKFNLLKWLAHDNNIK